MYLIIVLSIIYTVILYVPFPVWAADDRDSLVCVFNYTDKPIRFRFYFAKPNGTPYETHFYTIAPREEYAIGWGAYPSPKLHIRFDADRSEAGLMRSDILEKCPSPRGRGTQWCDQFGKRYQFVYDEQYHIELVAAPSAC